MMNFLAGWHNQRIAIRELSRLSDHQLADLGIARAEISAVARAAASAPRGRTVEVVQRITGSEDDMAPSWGHHNRRVLAA